MVLVKKGNQTFMVSMASYKDVFKKLGYEIVKGNKRGEVSKNTSSSKKNHNLEDELEEELIQKEQKENEIKTDEDKDVVTSEKLTEPIGIKIEDNFGFEPKADLQNDKYQEKLNALKDNSKLGK